MFKRNWKTTDNNGQQWTTTDNNGQQWTTMDNNGQHSAELRASVMPFFCWKALLKVLKDFLKLFDLEKFKVSFKKV